LLFNVKWIIFQLFHGQNKLCLNEDDDDDDDDDNDDDDDDDDDGVPFVKHAYIDSILRRSGNINFTVFGTVRQC